MMPTEGHGVLSDRYTLDRVIGRGGMADVYRATDHLLEREVAVKVLRTHTASERDRARFVREARTLARFDHPNLVSVLDAGINHDTPYLVMDLVEGRSLATACADGPLPARQVARIGVALATALAFVHEHGVVHRDLKPGNVLLGTDGVVRLADFGIARLLGDPGQTATGTLIGTAAYLAPEQVRGEPISPASDVYSLGLLLLEAASGMRAYTGTPTEAALARLYTGPPIPSSLSRPWVTLLRSMTDLEAARRPSAQEVARALRRLSEPGTNGATGRTAPAAPAAPAVPYVDGRPGTPERRGRPRASRRGWLVAAALAMLAAAIGATVLTLDGTEPTASASSQAAAPLPAGTPDRLRQPLLDLHEAAGSGPAVSGPLGRVDTVVAAGHWDAARERLDELVRATVRARDVGTLTAEQADAVQAAAARLAADLPGPKRSDGGGED